MHPPRDHHLDLLRALSLVVVVLWHWAFTILHWGPGGPRATSPLGFTSGLWILTWLLQVLPLFFYVGGAVHLLSWELASARGDGVRSYVWRQVRPLLLPALALIGAWVALGAVVQVWFGLRWVRGVVLLVISPLWFLGVYVVLIVLVPVTAWLHRRLDVLAVVWLGGIAMVVDVLRFRFGLSWLGWVNMAVVWGLAHQAGFFHRRLVAAPRRVAWALLSAGLFALVGLVFSGLYPGSMVGVPGDRMSNVGPPTFVLVALLAFQVGVVEVTRPAVQRALRRPRVRAVTELVNRFAVPLFLFHTTGMALARAVGYFVFAGRIADDRAPDLVWWLERPLAVLGPLLFTLPVIALFSLGRGRPVLTVRDLRDLRDLAGGAAQSESDGPDDSGESPGSGGSGAPSRSSRSAHSSSGASENAVSSMPSCRSPSSANRAGTVARVKSRGSRSGSSSQRTGVDTVPSATPRTE